jgi:hypothetical protein
MVHAARERPGLDIGHCPSNRAFSPRPEDNLAVEEEDWQAF